MIARLTGVSHDRVATIKTENEHEHDLVSCSNVVGRGATVNPGRAQPQPSLKNPC
jgi:hypothetical protein